MGSLIPTSRSVEDYLADVTFNCVIPFNIIHDELDVYVDDAYLELLLEPLVRTLEIRGLMDVVGYKFLKIKFDVEFVRDGIADGAFFATSSIDLYESLLSQVEGSLASPPDSSVSDSTLMSTLDLKTCNFSFESLDKLLAFVIRSEALALSEPSPDSVSLTLTFDSDSYVKSLPLSTSQLESIFNGL